MLPNEKFALECRERYAEDGLVVDKSNGEFAHCPLPKDLGDSGYYLLHDDHQWQGLLQSKDVGRKCFWTPYTKRWLMKANFVEGYFELWDIFDEFNKITGEAKKKLSELYKGKPGRPQSEETRRKIGEANKGQTRTEEAKKKLSELYKGKPGRPQSEETKNKISEAAKGRTHTEETKKKLSESMRLRAQLKRAVSPT